MDIYEPENFSSPLFEMMRNLCPAVAEMELYEFRYALDNLTPAGGWGTVALDSPEEIEQRVNHRAFYNAIQIKPKVGDRIVLDEPVVSLTRMLLVGLATGAYDPIWIDKHFYFDVRGFFFLHRTVYFTGPVLDHLGGRPYRQFPQNQKDFDCLLEVGYKAFQHANRELDACFIECVQKLIAARTLPVLLAIAGPTAAGKTEIVARLRQAFEQAGQKTTSIELDNFLTDRDYREEKGIFTLGKEALHFALLEQSLHDITQGKRVEIPRYDFVYATSSHNLDGTLKPGSRPIVIEPADLLFIEGNFPFLIEEVAPLIGIKVVYLTDDPVRLKRKWRRDIDYRKKYEPTYFRNRYFKDQFIMAEVAYRPQMAVCDLVVDTSGGALWATPEAAAALG